MQFGLEQQFRFVSDDLGFRRWPNPLLHSWYPLLCIIMLCQVTLESLSSPSFWKWGTPVFQSSFFPVLPWLLQSCEAVHMYIKVLECFDMLWCAHQDNLLHACLFHSGWRLGHFQNNHGDEQLGKSSLMVCIRPVRLEPGLKLEVESLTVPGEHREDEDVWPWAGAKSPDRLWQQGHWSGITLRHYVCLLGSAVCSSEILKTPLQYQLHFGHALKNTGTTRQPWKNAHLSMCREGIMCPKHSKTTGPHPEY